MGYAIPRDSVYLGINVPSVLNSKFGFTTECTTAVPPAGVAAVEAIDEKYLPWREKNDAISRFSGTTKVLQ